MRFAWKQSMWAQHLTVGFVRHYPWSCLHGQLCGHSALQVTCGRLHTICVTAQSQVYAWGHNSAGQLGLADRRDRYGLGRQWWQCIWCTRTALRQ